MAQELPDVIFLDRDGVINIDRKDFVRSWEEFEFVPGVLMHLRMINEMGIKVIIISNQSCVARGLITEKKLDFISSRMVSVIDKNGGSILDIFYCPHHPDGTVPPYNRECDCRKPKPGLIKKALTKYGIDPKKTWLVGDSQRDVDAGKSAGCLKTILTETDEGLKTVMEALLS